MRKIYNLGTRPTALEWLSVDSTKEVFKSILLAENHHSGFNLEIKSLKGLPTWETPNKKNKEHRSLEKLSLL